MMRVYEGIQDIWVESNSGLYECIMKRSIARFVGTVQKRRSHREARAFRSQERYNVFYIP